MTSGEFTEWGRMTPFFMLYCLHPVQTKPVTITLRPHQQTAVDAMLEHDKGQVIIPTGGGKTICMIQDYLDHEYLGCRTTVVVAPRILLAEQLCKEFLELLPKVIWSLSTMFTVVKLSTLAAPNLHGSTTGTSKHIAIN